MMTADQLVAKVDVLPAFPASVAQLLQRLRDPAVTAKDIEATLRPDPALTARLLALANSGYYRAVGQIGSVHDAVVRLGLKPVFALATGSALGRVVPARLAGYDIDAHDFLQHSVGVAVFAERLAKLAAPEVEGSAFTAGLLHDLGKLVVGSFLAEGHSGIVDAVDGQVLALLDAERQVLGTDHGEVGQIACAKWHLPELLGAGARYHHQPSAAPAGPMRRLAEVLHVADGLAHQFGLSTDIGEMHRKLELDVLASLKLKAGQLEAVVADGMAQVHQLTAAFAGSASGGSLSIVAPER